MKSSETLKRARKLIADRYEMFICSALAHLCHRKVITRAEMRALERHITTLLDGCVSYEVWVAKHHPSLWNGTSMRNVVAYHGRLAWIDHMIAEFKKKGD